MNTLLYIADRVNSHGLHLIVCTPHIQSCIPARNSQCFFTSDQVQPGSEIIDKIGQIGNLQCRTHLEHQLLLNKSSK